MWKDLLNYLKEYAPLAVFIVSAGAVVAAVITSISGLLLEIVKARTAERLDDYKAHRAYRHRLCRPVLRYSRAFRAISEEIHFTIANDKFGVEGAELRELMRGWIERMRSATAQHRAVFIPTGDKTVDETIGLMYERKRDLVDVLASTKTKKDPAIRYDTYEAAVRLLEATSAVHVAIEGFVYNVAPRRKWARAVLNKPWPFKGRA